METKDAVARKLRALQALTVENGCTEHEAMAAAKKIAVLLAEHDMTLSELSADELAGQELDMGQVVEEGQKTVHPVILWTAVQVGDFCDVKVWHEKGIRYLQQSDQVRYFGYVPDVQAALYLTVLLRNCAESEYRAFRAKNGWVEHQGFMAGFAGRVNVRLREMKRARDRSTTEATGRDLVLVKKPAVEAGFAKLDLDLQAGKDRERVRDDDRSIMAGVLAGERVTITTGIAGQPEQARLS